MKTFDQDCSLSARSSSDSLMRQPSLTNSREGASGFISQDLTVQVRIVKIGFSAAGRKTRSCKVTCFVCPQVSISHRLQVALLFSDIMETVILTPKMVQ